MRLAWLYLLLMPRSHKPGLPSREQILDFISKSESPAGKREISRAFGLQGNEKIALKALLKDMADEGLIDSAPGRAFHKMGGIPKVTVLRVVDITDEGIALAIPEAWQGDGPPPQLRIREARGAKGAALGVGDRILARTEEAGRGWIAHPLKRPAARRGNHAWHPSPRRRPSVAQAGRQSANGVDTLVSDAGDCAGRPISSSAEKAGRPPRITARVTERLGDPFAPRSFSLVAIHKFGIPDVFGESVIEEAELVPASRSGRGA